MSPTTGPNFGQIGDVPQTPPLDLIDPIKKPLLRPLCSSLSVSPFLPSTLSVLAHRAHGLTPRPTPTALLYFAKTPRTPPLEGKFWKVRLPAMSAMRRGARIDKTAHKRRRITLFALLEPSEGRSDDGRHRPRGNVGIGCVNCLCIRKWLCLT